MDSYLTSRISDLENEVISLKESRNYYKDQCETLILAVSQLSESSSPSFRTQKEVDEMIQNITEFHEEKTRRMTEELEKENDLLKKKVENLEKVRLELIEGAMMSPKSLVTPNIEEYENLKRDLRDTSEILACTLKEMALLEQEVATCANIKEKLEETEERLVKEEARRKAAELARDVSVVNMKGAYRLLSEGESSIKEKETRNSRGSKLSSTREDSIALLLAEKEAMERRLNQKAKETSREQELKEKLDEALAAKEKAERELSNLTQNLSFTRNTSFQQENTRGDSLNDTFTLLNGLYR